MQDFPFISHYPPTYPEEEMLQRAEAFQIYMSKRRTVRHFADKPVPKAMIEQLILTASSAPSGANKQPWFFCAVSDPRIKREIRTAAEKEEYENYHGRMSDEWLDDLAPLRTNWKKEFLETAPWLIVVFKQIYDLENGEKKKNYYVNESVGIACGFLLAALQNAGLVALTHTPSPMNFLQKILNRPDNERPYLLIPIGYAAKDVRVPDIPRKEIYDVLKYY